MVAITSSDAIQRFVDEAKLQSANGVPTQLNNQIVPVFEVNPRLTRFCDIVKTNSIANQTSATIYTTPTDKDFFLTSASLSYIKDVTSTSTGVAINVTINGLATSVLALPGITLTVSQGQISNTFLHPLKIDRNTNIAVISSTSVANIKAQGCISGYIAS